MEALNFWVEGERLGGDDLFFLHKQDAGMRKIRKNWGDLQKKKKKVNTGLATVI